MLKVPFSVLSATTSEWDKAVVVFTPESFATEYSVESRSYEINSWAKYFDSTKHGSSLFGNCLDGTEGGVRLDLYLYDGWEIDYCYVTRTQRLA